MNIVVYAVIVSLVVVLTSLVVRRLLSVKEAMERETARYVIKVGRRSAVDYAGVAAEMICCSGAERVVILARGRNISKAVDVAELVKRVFNGRVVVEDIKIGTEVLEGRRVSTIEIVLAATPPLLPRSAVTYKDGVLMGHEISSVDVLRL